MSEREMRSAIRLMLAELERCGRPLLLGAGLALAGGPEGCAALQPAADASRARDAGAAKDAGADHDLSIAVAMYSAPGCSAAPF